MRDAGVRIIGFWADAARQGVYTRPDKRTHLHFILDDDTASGHIDDVHLREGAFIHLPRYGEGDGQIQ